MSYPRFVICCQVLCRRKPRFIEVIRGENCESKVTESIRTSRLRTLSPPNLHDSYSKSVDDSWWHSRNCAFLNTLGRYQHLYRFFCTSVEERYLNHGSFQKSSLSRSKFEWSIYLVPDNLYHILPFLRLIPNLTIAPPPLSQPFSKSMPLFLAPTHYFLSRGARWDTVSAGVRLRKEHDLISARTRLHQRILCE